MVAPDPSIMHIYSIWFVQLTHSVHPRAYLIESNGKPPLKMKGKSNKKSGVNIIFLKEDESLYLVVCVLTYRIIDSVIRYTIILVES